MSQWVSFVLFSHKEADNQEQTRQKECKVCGHDPHYIEQRMNNFKVAFLLPLFSYFSFLKNVGIYYASVCLFACACHVVQVTALLQWTVFAQSHYVIFVLRSLLFSVPLFALLSFSYNLLLQFKEDTWVESHSRERLKRNASRQIISKHQRNTNA